MADKETTLRLKADISSLKKEFANAQQSIRLVNSEFKAATAGMDDWTNNADGLTAKLNQLHGVLDAEKKKLNSLEDQYEKTVQLYGANSRAAQDLAVKINNQKAAVASVEKEIRKYSDKLDEVESESKDAAKGSEQAADAIKDVGESAEKAESKLGGLLSKLGGVAKGALKGIGAAATGVIGAFLGSAEASQEWIGNMAKLESAANDAGYSTDFAKDKFNDLYGVLGDETAANTAVSNFMALETSEENLNSLLHSATGIWAKYGDSIPLDGLAESVNETAKVGQITGNLADALNWAGISEDKFNEQLAACTTEQQRQDLIAKTLNDTYGDLADEYNKNNEATINYNKAQAELNDAMAQVGKAAMPVMTVFKSLGAEIINDIMPNIQELGSSFTDLVNGVDGAGERLGGAVSGILTQLTEKLVSALPQIVTVGTTIITNLLTGIMQALPSIATAAVQLVTELVTAIQTAAPTILTAAGDVILTLVNGLTQAAPTILTGVVGIFQQIVTSLVEFIPQFLTAAIQFFSTLVTAIMQLDLFSVISSLVMTITTTLIGAIPQLLTAAQQLFSAILKAIPTLIEQLMTALPQVILTLINFIVKAVPQLMKAAMQLFNAIVDAIPVIISSLTKQLPQIIKTIVSALTKALPLLLKAAIDLLMQIVNAIPQIVNMLSKQLPSIIDTILTAVLDALPLLLDAAIKLLMQLVNAIPQIVTALLKTLPTIINTILKVVIKALPQLLDAAIKLFMQLVKAIPQIVTALIKALPTIIKTIINVLLESMPLLLKASIELFMALVQAIPKMIVELVKELPTIGATIIGELGKLPKKMLSIGGDIVRGLWNGINDMVGWIGDKISGFGDSVLNGLKSFFGIASPSKVFRDEIGKFLPQGLAVGVEAKTKDAVNAIKKMGEKVMIPARNIASGLNDSLQISSGKLTATAAEATATSGATVVNNFYQTNNSPKSLDRLELYRQTKNLLSIRG